MDTITLKCPIVIKARVTDSLRKQIANEVQDAIKKADLELQQIEFHAKRMMAEQAKQDAQGLVALRQQIDAEKKKRIEPKNSLAEKLKETAKLENGSEIVQGSMDRYTTVTLGDNLYKIMSAEILLEDGKIIKLRD